jgi:hypothetical protein
MAEEPEDEDGPRALDLSVDQYFALEGLNSRDFPVTVEVRNQLANLLLESAGTPQHASYEALFRAVMTAVSGLEATSLVHFKKVIEFNNKVLDLNAELLNLRSNTLDVYSNLIELRTELLERGVISPTPLPEIDWFLDDYEDDDDD